jgi:hypothetical protein
MAAAVVVAAAEVKADTATAVAVMVAEADVATAALVVAALVVAAKAKADMATATTAEMGWVVAAMAVMEVRGPEAAAVAVETDVATVAEEPEEVAEGMRRELVVGTAAVAGWGEGWAWGAARREH